MPIPPPASRYLVRINGKPVPASRATVSVFDHGFLFGDSVYEVIRTYGGRLFTAPEHLVRLRRSARRLGLAVPWSDAWLVRELRRLLRAGKYPEAYLRLVVTRGPGEVNICPSSCARPTLVLFARALPPYPAACFTKGIAIHLARIHRNARNALDPNIKSGNYLNNILALREAPSGRIAEVVMCNAAGELTEGTTSNIFLVKRGVLLTPPITAGILAGITRKLVLSQARRHRLPCREETLSPRDLFDADEVFLSSTTRAIMPVTRMPGRKLGRGRPGPVTSRLREIYAREIPRHLS